MLLVLVPLLLGATRIRAGLPSYITPCSRNDPKLNECYFQRAREAIPHILKGDPTLGIPNMDPLLLEKVNMELGNGLIIDMTNVVIRGFDEVTVGDISHDMIDYSGTLELGLPKLTIITDYSADGKIFDVPIKGKGKGNFTMTDVKLYMASPYELVKRSDGEQYISLYNTTVDFDMSRLYTQLNNLFSGNKFLDESMNLVINENWKQLLKLGKPFLLDGMQSLVRYVIEPIATSVKYDEVFPPNGIWI